MCRHGRRTVAVCASILLIVVYRIICDGAHHTGIRNAFSADEFRPDIGVLWENWAIAQVAKHNALLGSPAELFFWRTRAQSEVDLMVKEADRLRAFEVKWSPGRVSGRAFHDA